MARLPDSFLEELKSRAPIAAIVGQTVRLKAAGSGRFKGLCPFHDEKTPSFHVDEAKGFYHCFGCKASGTAVNFVMATENLAFMDAVRKVAAHAGMEVPRTGGPVDPERERRWRRAREALDAAQAYFETELRAPAGRAAREYLKARGIQGAEAKAFGLGYAPQHGRDLAKRMRAAGISDDGQLDAGLLGRDDRGRTYPFFRDRVTFPIADRLGKVVAFGGRALDPKTPAKYLNSRETIVFDKGRTLYNLHQARQAVRAAGALYVVEGYMDVIALSMHGFEATVAPLGTALTSDQMRVAWQLHDEPVLCMDGDAAGRAAAIRAMETVLPSLAAGRSLRFAFLPAGEDPDSLVRSRGADAFREVAANARPLVDLAWETEYARETLDTPERKVHFQERLKRLVQTIDDHAVRNAYHEEFARRYQETCHGTLETRAPGTGSARRPPSPPVRVRERFAMRGPDRLVTERHRDAQLNQGAARRERSIVQAVINVPELLDHVEEKFAEVPFRAVPDLDAVRTELLNRHAQSDPVDPSSVRPWLEGRGLAGLLDEGASSDRWDSRRVVEPFVLPDGGLNAALAGWEAAVQIQLAWVHRHNPPPSATMEQVVAPGPDDEIPWSQSQP
ncbi:MAG: DNA primase [Alphaproteobacteria bacterium]|nr:DNA primase [Alphaproteobacteria bacterium]